MDVSGSCGNVWDPKPITHGISKLGVLFTNAVDQLLAAFILREGLAFWLIFRSWGQIGGVE
jgi:hypothetical protein